MRLIASARALGTRVLLAGAAGEQDRVEVAAQIRGGEVLADGDARPEHDALGRQQLDQVGHVVRRFGLQQQTDPRWRTSHRAQTGDIQ